MDFGELTVWQIFDGLSDSHDLFRFFFYFKLAHGFDNSSKTCYSRQFTDLVKKRKNQEEIKKKRETALLSNNYPYETYTHTTRDLVGGQLVEKFSAKMITCFRINEFDR